MNFDLDYEELVKRGVDICGDEKELFRISRQTPVDFNLVSSNMAKSTKVRIISQYEEKGGNDLPPGYLENFLLKKLSVRYR